MTNIPQWLRLAILMVVAHSTGCATTLAQAPSHIRLGGDVEEVREIATLLEPDAREVAIVYDPSERVASISIGRAIVLVLNRVDLQRLDAVHGIDAAFGVIAHEFGHVVAWPDTSQSTADYWAGCILRAAGREVQPFANALATLGAGPDRVAAARDGWESCRRNGDAILLVQSRPR